MILLGSELSQKAGLIISKTIEEANIEHQRADYWQ